MLLLGILVDASLLVAIMLEASSSFVDSENSCHACAFHSLFALMVVRFTEVGLRLVIISPKDGRYVVTTCNSFISFLIYLST